MLWLRKEFSDDSLIVFVVSVGDDSFEVVDTCLFFSVSAGRKENAMSTLPLLCLNGLKEVASLSESWNLWDFMKIFYQK